MADSSTPVDVLQEECVISVNSSSQAYGTLGNGEPPVPVVPVTSPDVEMEEPLTSVDNVTRGKGEPSVAVVPVTSPDVAAQEMKEPLTSVDNVTRGKGEPPVPVVPVTSPDVAAQEMEEPLTSVDNVTLGNGEPPVPVVPVTSPDVAAQEMEEPLTSVDNVTLGNGEPPVLVVPVTSPDVAAQEMEEPLTFMDTDSSAPVDVIPEECLISVNSSSQAYVTLGNGEPPVPVVPMTSPDVAAQEMEEPLICLGSTILHDVIQGMDESGDIAEFSCDECLDDSFTDPDFVLKKDCWYSSDETIYSKTTDDETEQPISMTKRKRQQTSLIQRKKRPKRKETEAIPDSCDSDDSAIIPQQDAMKFQLHQSVISFTDRHTTNTNEFTTETTNSVRAWAATWKKEMAYVKEVSDAEIFPTAITNSIRDVARSNEEETTDKEDLYTGISQKGPGLFKRGTVKSGCKQIYDKSNFCTFCRKGIQSKIARHLLTVHKDHPRVSNIRLLPKRSKSRMLQLDLLANEGNFKHNGEVLRTGEGCLVIARRSGQESKPHDSGEYLPCEYCRKFILKTTLWHHARNCSVRKWYQSETNVENECGYIDDEEQGGPESPILRQAVRRGRSLLYSMILKTDEQLLSSLLNRMQDGEVKETVIRDDLIKRYSTFRMESLGDKNEQKLNDVHRVSQGARTLAKLLLEARKKVPLLTMDSLIQPKHFDLVVSTVKALSFEKEKPSLSLARYTGNLLGHVIQIKIGTATRCDNDQKLQEATKFQKLYETEWNYRVNAVSVKKINVAKRNQVKTIPLTEDLKLLTAYIRTGIKESSSALQKTKSPNDWTRIAKLTMCRLILFNKRRKSEVQDLKVTDYLKRPLWHEDQSGEMAMALSPVDRILANRMDMMVSAGKSRKNVDAFVLMPPDSKYAIDLLIQTRDEVGIPQTNEYIFARIYANSPLSGNAEMRDLAHSCPGVRCPERITSTSLRKYIATVSQVLDMSEKDLEVLATHLGHDPKTHKEFYRLSDSTIELSKVSQLLLAVENGQVNQWRGRKLSDISIEDLPDVESESDDGNDVSAEDATEGGYAGDLIKAAVGSVSRSAEVDGVNKEHIRVRWTTEQTDVLKKVFKRYLTGKGSLHNVDLQKVILNHKCLAYRTLSQIRTKCNNIRLGKSK